MKRSHYQTPRTMRDAFGEDTRLSVKEFRDSTWAYIAAAGLVVAMVWMACS